jgi:hypothetical protein
MKHKHLTAMLAAFVLALASAATFAQDQHQHQHGAEKPAAKAGEQKQQAMKHDMSQMDMSAMMKEPHHLLAMAYMHNVGVFAKAVNAHATSGGAIDASFARSAVAEIRRSLDEHDKHMKEHMQAAAHRQMMSGDMRAHMEQMMKEMETHQAKLKDAVASLEKDVRGTSPDAKRLASDSSDILKHLDEMSKMEGGNEGHKMNQ